MRDTFWCKHCKTEFLIDVPENYTGDAFVLCPNEWCGWRHPRQFVGGVAVGCETPSGSRYVLIEQVRLRDY